MSDVHPCAKSELGDIGADPPGVVPNVRVKVDFSCADLTVPVDHGLLPGPRTAGNLTLKVSMADNTNAPRGVLLWLVGGPGEPGVPLTADITSGFDPAVLKDYRMVFLSGRGTGDNALDCPGLQKTVGSSDLAAPTGTEVADCARRIGDLRKYFTTADMVGDIEDLRRALGAEKLSLDGASYGSYVAERYAIAHPDRISRLVLDSVVPHDGFDLLDIDGITRTAQVLRQVCRETRCAGDPAAELSQVVHAGYDGVMLLDLVAGLSSGHPELAGLLPALHSAAGGDHRQLDALVERNRRLSATTAAQLSQGLHTATICGDMDGPWGNASAPLAGRAEAVRAKVSSLPEADFFPFDRETAANNGGMLACAQWPPVPVVPFAAGQRLPDVPVLVLAGDHDLDTPLSDAQKELATAPRGRLVVIPGSGHITQDHANGAGGREAVKQFLTYPAG